MGEVPMPDVFPLSWFEGGDAAASEMRRTETRLTTR